MHLLLNWLFFFMAVLQWALLVALILAVLWVIGWLYEKVKWWLQG